MFRTLPSFFSACLPFPSSLLPLGQWPPRWLLVSHAPCFVRATQCLRSFLLVLPPHLYSWYLSSPYCTQLSWPTSSRSRIAVGILRVQFSTQSFTLQLHIGFASCICVSFDLPLPIPLTPLTGAGQRLWYRSFGRINELLHLPLPTALASSREDHRNEFSLLF